MERLKLNDKNLKKTDEDRNKLKHEKRKWKEDMVKKGIDPKKALNGNKFINSIQ